mmetsp:Transcript_32244/g.84538  ORF Transcript_32244/g.84538 Transcript_32244/m.84538 type:complete len:154 (-) Transcript_32244:2053-2514(-)
MLPETAFKNLLVRKRHKVDWSTFLVCGEPSPLRTSAAFFLEENPQLAQEDPSLLPIVIHGLDAGRQTYNARSLIMRMPAFDISLPGTHERDPYVTHLHRFRLGSSSALTTHVVLTGRPPMVPDGANSDLSSRVEGSLKRQKVAVEWKTDQWYD